MAKRKRQQSRRPETSSLEDWASALAKRTLESSATKQERMEMRAAKKRRREERNNNSKVQSLDVVDPKQTKADSSGTRSKNVDNDKRNDTRQAEMNRRLVSHVAREMRECVESYSAQQRRGSVYGVDAVAKKARNKKKAWVEANTQPRHRDYGGIGLARPSMFLDLDDPALSNKLKEEFEEHIPGFFGKQRTKAMKKQQGSKILWRQLADKKNADKKFNGKKLKDMSADERVEAMIKGGMV